MFAEESQLKAEDLYFAHDEIGPVISLRDRPTGIKILSVIFPSTSCISCHLIFLKYSVPH